VIAYNSLIEMGLFKKIFKKKTNSSEWHLTLQLNARIMPLDRGDTFEDPIDQVLKELGIGEVDGGGTLLSKNGEIEYCDVEIYLNERSDTNYDKLHSFLMQLGVPKGSFLISEDDKKEIGDLEGLAIYLDRTDLDENPESCDINRLLSELTEVLRSEHKYGSYWEGSEETALYFYGRSFDKMKGLTVQFIEKYPLRNRIIQVA
jgi:hypothetical protein